MNAHTTFRSAFRSTLCKTGWLLIQISSMHPSAIVAILSSDHYYSSKANFTLGLQSVLRITEERSRSVLILGIDPKRLQVQYGWVPAGATVSGYPEAHQVVALHDRPSLSATKRPLRRGSAWGSFVMLGHICTLLQITCTMTRLFRRLTWPKAISDFGGAIRISDSLTSAVRRLISRAKSSLAPQIVRSCLGGRARSGLGWGFPAASATPFPTKGMLLLLNVARSGF